MPWYKFGIKEWEWYHYAGASAVVVGICAGGFLIAPYIGGAFAAKGGAVAVVKGATTASAITSATGTTLVSTGANAALVSSGGLAVKGSSIIMITKTVASTTAVVASGAAAEKLGE